MLQKFDSTHPRFVDLIPPNCQLLGLLALLPALGNGVWLVGGAIRRTIIGKEIDSDLDIVFSSKENKDKFHAALSSAGFVPTEVGTNTNWLHPGIKNVKVQTIYLRYYNSPEEIFSTFDFTICQFAFDGNSLYCGECALFDLANRRLVPNNIMYASASLRRIIKYSKQNFYLCSGAASEFLRKVISNPSSVLNQTLS